MKRQTYKGFVIDTDNLGRIYIYNTASPYSEDSDRKVGFWSIADAKKRINEIIADRNALESLNASLEQEAK